jgi:hypothetical protein
VKRSTRVAFWLFERSRAARTVFILAVWPFTYVADRWHRVDPPSSLRTGLDWAKGGAEDVARLKATLLRVDRDEPPTTTDPQEGP